MLPFSAKRHEGGNGAIRIVFSGELDLATLPSAEEHLCRAEADGRLIVVDLRELAFMDLSCLHMIEAADRRMRKGGGRLVIVRGHRPVHRVFELTKMDERLEIIDHPAS
jgi:anti-sigma B factor antagonist